MNLRSTIGRLDTEVNNANTKVLAWYNPANNQYRPEFVAQWDHIQKKMRCCGTQGGFRDFSNMQNNFTNHCVPDSCCIDKCDGMDHISDCIESNIFHKVYNEPCLTLMRRQFSEGYLPLFLLMVSIGLLITAVIGIVNVALSAAFVAQLTRKAKTWDVSQGIREQPPSDNMRMDSFVQ